MGDYSVTDIQLGSEYAKMQEEILTHNEAIVEGSEEQRILDRYFDDFSVFYEKCSEKGDIFLLNALSPAYKASMGGSEVDGESPNVIYASDSAGRYIADVTGIEPDKKKICDMIIPLTHHSFAPKPSLTASSGEYGEGFALVTDPSGLRLEPHYLRYFNWCVKYITIYNNIELDQKVQGLSKKSPNLCCYFISP